MATKYTSVVNIQGNSRRRYRGYVSATVSNVDNDTSRITWSARVEMYNAAQYGVGVKCYVGGTLRKTDTGYLSSSPGTSYKTAASVSGTTDYTRGTSAKSVTVTVNAYGTTVSGYGSAGGSASASVTVTIPALPSYTVAYNANGGSGAPGSQTKWYGKTLKLSSTKPTRTGYTFQGWATSSGGSVAYAAGANYTSNASATLYAVWKANTWAISYNANGGSGAPAAQTKIYGQTLTLSSTKPTRTNYNFLGWSTSSSATSAQYAAGGTFTTNANVTLYAVWQLAYVAPRITNLKADRCNSAGTLTEDGTYARITFNWATDKTVSSIQITCNGATTNVSGSGTSGSVTKVVGAGGLNTEYSYAVTVKVADSMGSSTQGQTVAPLDYIIDFSPQGGVGVGIPAPNSKEFQVATPLITTTRLTGFMNRGYHGNSTTWYWKTLARAQVPTSNLGGGGSITVRGVLGGYGGSTSGTVEITVAIREPSATTVIVDKFGPALFNNGYAAIIFKIDSSGYLTLYLATCGYYSYNLFVEADRQVNIIDSSWFTGEPAGTTLINTRYVKTDQFGGYPAKLEKLNGYYGFAFPDKTRTDWLRTTSRGLIPYQAGTPAPSSLGTATWRFNNGYIDNVHTNNLYVSNLLIKRSPELLWSGGLFMKANQSVALSKGMSSFPRGLVLCWSAYTANTVRDYWFNFTFVPKDFNDGYALSCFLAGSNEPSSTRVAVKYVYISENKITGHAANDGSGNGSASLAGLTLSNGYFVLRKVYGV